MPHKKPLIGITLDYFDPNVNEQAKFYSNQHWYAHRGTYTEAVKKSGGTPLLIPYDFDSLDIYVDIIDGLIIPGGGLDIHPKFYDEDTIHHTVTLKEPRTDFEMAITQRFLKTNKPFLGICGGMQLMNVAYGGSLYQDLPSFFPSNIDHLQSQARNIPQHDVTVSENSLLYGIVKTNNIQVNSVHHQGIKSIAKDLIASGFAPDGLIEAIEDQSKTFCLGVQWHPEVSASNSDNQIFERFIKACK